MPTYTQEEVEQRFARLPESLKEQMMSVENSERIFEAGKKFGLTIEQIGFLAEESGYVVLGLTHPKDFVAKLKDHLHVDEDKAKNIAKEINHHVFFPLREILKTTHQFELTQEEIQTPPQPIPSMPHVQPPIPKPSPAPSSETRPIERPVIQSGIQPPIKQTPPPVITPSAPSLPPINKPIPSPAVPPISDVKLPAIPALIKPVAPHVAINTPAPIMFPSKPPLPPIPTTPTPLSRHTSRPPERGEQGLTINLKTAMPIPPPPPVPPIPQSESRPIEQPIIQSQAPLMKRPAIQAENRPMSQPTPPAISKSVEGIKPKESALISTLPPQPQEIPQAPLAPSQIMQKKLLEETKHVKPPAQTEVERMKESLFAPPSAPLEPKPAPEPSVKAHAPPQANISTPPTPPSQAPEPHPNNASTFTPPPTPSPYSNRDPYREPID